MYRTRAQHLAAPTGFYTPQPCGRTYDQFRSGYTYKDAYDMLAYGAKEEGVYRTIGRSTVMRALSKLKKEAFDLYTQDCDWQQAQREEAEPAAAPAEPRRRIEECVRVCRTRSKPCGRSCVTKKLVCRKGPSPDVCSVDEFQLPLPHVEPAGREGEYAEAGDTSFDPGMFGLRGALWPSRR